MIIVGLGLMIGLCGAFALTRWMGNLLYGVGTHDLSIHALVILLLASAGLVASYIPARRATAVDPMIALRYEYLRHVTNTSHANRFALRDPITDQVSGLQFDCDCDTRARHRSKHRDF